MWEDKKWNRKDLSPEKTVQIVKDILKNIGVSTSVKDVVEFEDKWYSLRLEIDGLPGIGTNGKGVSREYAMASAYGELMERIQTGVLIKKMFTRKSSNKSYFSDGKVFEIEEIEKDAQDIFNIASKHASYEEIIKLLLSNVEYRFCIPYYNVNKNNVKFLPIRLIKLLTGTNGLCAGNSPAEAIVQGFSEILERYVHKKIFLEHKKVPTIPIMNLQKLKSFLLLKKIIELGYQPIVKDCTMDGKYPVVGIILLNPARTKYLFSLGADPNLDIALQRCITEIFQGKSFNNAFDNKYMVPINYYDDSLFKVAPKDKTSYLLNYKEWIKSICFCSGLHPITIFHDELASKNYLRAFKNENISNTEALIYIKNLLVKENFNIYIRDCSYLGFPTYSIYIPGISETKSLFSEEIDFRIKEKNLTEYLVELGKGNFENSNILLDNIKKINMVKISDNSGGLVKSFNLCLNNYLIKEKFNSKLYACYILYNQKKYNEAFEYLQSYVRDERVLAREGSDYFIGLLIYLRNKANDVSNEDIFIILKGILSQDIYKLLVDNIENNNIFDKIIKFPSCPNCSVCSIKDNCCVDEWQKINRTLIELECNSTIDQENISKIFKM